MSASPRGSSIAMALTTSRWHCLAAPAAAGVSCTTYDGPPGQCFDAILTALRVATHATRTTLRIDLPERGLRCQRCRRRGAGARARHRC